MHNGDKLFTEESSPKKSPALNVLNLPSSRPIDIPQASSARRRVCSESTDPKRPEFAGSYTQMAAFFAPTDEPESRKRSSTEPPPVPNPACSHTQYLLTTPLGLEQQRRAYLSWLDAQIKARKASSLATSEKLPMVEPDDVDDESSVTESSTPSSP